MEASFKFVKFKSGKGSFAEIRLRSEAADELSIRWMDELIAYEIRYADPVNEGITEAVNWHRNKTRKLASFLVTKLLIFEVDTKPNDVRCAATVAAWKALGHAEADIGFEYDGAWKAKLNK